MAKEKVLAKAMKLSMADQGKPKPDGFITQPARAEQFKQSLAFERPAHQIGCRCWTCKPPKEK